MWYKTIQNGLDASTVMYYKKSFKDKILSITFNHNPKWKMIAFRGISYINSAGEIMTDEDVLYYGNPYHMSLKCVFEPTSGIMGTEKIL